MSRAPSAAELVAIPYFGELTQDEAGALAAGAVVRTFGARQLVAIQGDPTAGFYYLRTGKARILRSGADGRERTLRLLGPGDTFGEVPVFDGGAMPATVETIEPCEVVLFPAAVFRSIVERHPAVAAAVLRHFAGRMRAFTEMIEAISLQTVQARLARYLYQLAREEGRQAPEGVIVPRQITQQDLASFIGSVREVVSRTLKVMDEDGLVEIRRTDILIRDVEGLKAML